MITTTLSGAGPTLPLVEGDAPIDAPPRRRSTLDAVVEGAKLGWPIDLGLLGATIAAIVTHAVVLWFHLIFVLLVLAALALPFRQFALRLAIWAVVSTSLVVWAVVSLATPSDELTELPILTAVIVLVFLVARARAQTHAALERSQELMERRLVHERDNLRTQLEQSQRLDVLGRASTRMAHDLRNVLTIVKGCAAEIATADDVRQQARAGEVLAAVDRGIDMIEELLAVGRQNRGAVDALDIADAVRHAEPILRHLVRDEIALDVAVPDEPIRVVVDRTALMQILMNLVSNAVDAIDGPGRVTIAVGVTTRHAGNGGGPVRSATISVTDTGRGLAADHVESLFQPGFTTKSGHHSGLGLATVWQIVSRNGGITEFESLPLGSRVVVQLPCAAAGPAKQRVLLAVNDPTTRRLVHGELAANGCAIVAVDREHAAATELATVGSIDLAIVDGPTAVRDLGDLAPGARVVRIDGGDGQDSDHDAAVHLVRRALAADGTMSSPG